MCRLALASVAPEIASSKPLALASKRLPALQKVVTFASEADGAPLTWSEFIGCATDVSVDALRERQLEQSFDEPINIQYTSGTTGIPKGATPSHHHIPNNGYFVAHRQDPEIPYAGDGDRRARAGRTRHHRLIHDPANAPAPSLGRCVGLSAPADSYGYVLVQKGQNEEILMNFWY